MDEYLNWLGSTDDPKGALENNVPYIVLPIQAMELRSMIQGLGRSGGAADLWLKQHFDVPRVEFLPTSMYKIVSDAVRSEQQPKSRRTTQRKK